MTNMIEANASEIMKVKGDIHYIMSQDYERQITKILDVLSKILWSLKIMILGNEIIISIWNLTWVLAAELQKHLLQI